MDLHAGSLPNGSAKLTSKPAAKSVPAKGKVKDTPEERKKKQLEEEAQVRDQELWW